MEEEEEENLVSRKRSLSISSSSSSSSYDDEEDRSRRKKRKKKKKKKKHKKKKKKKSRKKRKTDDESSSSPPSGAFGSRGVLRDSDLSRGTKSLEFEMWCREIRGEEVSMLGVRDRLNVFKTFAEDFNTVTLPHEKYYDYRAWSEKKMKKNKKKSKQTVSNDDDSLSDDRKRKDKLDAAYAQLHRMSAVKAQVMRDRDILMQKMQIAYKSGDTAEVTRLRSVLGLS